MKLNISLIINRAKLGVDMTEDVRNMNMIISEKEVY